jgi:ABC-type Fe3+ transport system substrate-binding protein
MVLKVNSFLIFICSLIGSFISNAILLAEESALDQVTKNTIVVISPHNSVIQNEFTLGFKEWYKRLFNQDVHIDWRNTGGSSESLKFVLSEFVRTPNSIGIDCFFGGGYEPYLILKNAGLLQRVELPKALLQHIPDSIGGINIYDPDLHWFGAALSCFGILQNKKIIQINGLPEVFAWHDLTSPGLYGWVGAADPRKSGTMTVIFESILQLYGWNDGWKILAIISANVRNFDRVAAATAKDVFYGEIAYGITIDFYALTQINAAGKTNLFFALPKNAAVPIPDGIAMLKGAPNPAVTSRFIEFVLSESGQKLWFLPPGQSGGPKKYFLSRLTVQSDLYEKFKDIISIDNPYKNFNPDLVYDVKKAQVRRDIINAIAGAILVDTHDELKKAWKTAIENNKTRVFISNFPTIPITEDEAIITSQGAWNDPAFRANKKIEWIMWAKKTYSYLKAICSN